MVFFLQEADPVPLQFFRADQHPAGGVGGILRELLVKVLHRGTDVRRGRERGVERNLPGCADFLFEIERHGFVIDPAVGRVFGQDEIPEIADGIPRQADVLDIQRIGEGMPVAAFPKIFGDRVFREFDFFEGPAAELEFCIEPVKGLIPFLKPFAVFPGQGDDAQVLRRQAGEDETVPVGPELSGGRDGFRQRDLVERRVAGHAYLVEGRQVLMVFFPEEGAPQRSRFREDGNESQIHLVADVFMPRGTERRAACGILQRKGDLRPGVVVGSPDAVQVAQPVDMGCPERGDERSVDIGPPGVESGDLGVFEFQHIPGLRGVVIGFRPADQEILFRQQDIAPRFVIGAVRLVEGLQTPGTGTEFAAQPSAVFPERQGDHTPFLGHSDRAPVMRFGLAHGGQELFVVVEPLAGRTFRHGQIGHSPERQPEDGKQIRALAVVFGLEVFSVKHVVVENIFREQRKPVEIHIAFDRSGNHEQQRIHHGGGAEQQHQVDRCVEYAHLPAFPFDFSDDRHVVIFPWF